MKHLHIHIERGPYTTEWIEKFIEKALSENLEEICLLEHSVRFTDNQRKEHWNGRNVNHTYERYFELENSLVNSGIFDIIAHPDLITCFGFYPDYDLTDTYKKLCENIRKNNVMMEMNTSKGLGVNRQFFETAVQSGVSFSTGSDAHCPEDVGRGIKKVSSMIQMP